MYSRRLTKKYNLFSLEGMREKNDTFRKGKENACKNDKIYYPKGLIECPVQGSKRECI